MSQSASPPEISTRTYLLGLPLWTKTPTGVQAARIEAQLFGTDMRSAAGLRSTSSADTRYSNKDEIKPYAELC